jgi:hypothetical protein
MARLQERILEEQLANEAAAHHNNGTNNVTID